MKQVKIPTNVFSHLKLGSTFGVEIYFWMTQQEYQQEIDFIFNRFPSYQKVGKVAYKPGIETMLALDGLLGFPHRSYKTIHVAGTNGKGSTSHFLAAALQKNY